MSLLRNISIKKLKITAVKVNFHFHRTREHAITVRFLIWLPLFVPLSEAICEISIMASEDITLYLKIYTDIRRQTNMSAYRYTAASLECASELLYYRLNRILLCFCFQIVIFLEFYCKSPIFNKVYFLLIPFPLTPKKQFRFEVYCRV